MEKEIIKRVSKIARLELTEKEEKEFSKDLNDILKAFSSIDKANTEGLKPTFQPIEVKNVCRQDKSKKGLTQKEALMNSPHTEEGFFKGPKVV